LSISSFRLLERANAIRASAEEAERPLTPEERGRFEDLIDRAKEAQEIERKYAELEGGVRIVRGIEGAGFGGPGDRFVQSAEYQSIADPQGRAQRFSSGPVQVADAPFGIQTKGTLLESTAGGPGGGLFLAARIEGRARITRLPLRGQGSRQTNNASLNRAAASYRAREERAPGRLSIPSFVRSGHVVFATGTGATAYFR
jgi:hypothetical protein